MADQNQSLGAIIATGVTAQALGGAMASDERIEKHLVELRKLLK